MKKDWELFDPEKVPTLNPDPLQEQRLAAIAHVRERYEAARGIVHTNLDAVHGFRAGAVDLGFVRKCIQDAWTKHPHWTPEYVALAVKHELPEIVQGIKALYVAPQASALDPERPWIAVMLSTEDDLGLMTYYFTVSKPRARQ